MKPLYLAGFLALLPRAVLAGTAGLVVSGIVGGHLVRPETPFHHFTVRLEITRIDYSSPETGPDEYTAGCTGVFFDPDPERDGPVGILTAAHCVSDYIPEPVCSGGEIVGLESVYSPVKDGKVRVRFARGNFGAVEMAFTPHPGYGILDPTPEVGWARNDLAVATLPGGGPARVNPAELVDPNAPDPSFGEILAAGYGWTTPIERLNPCGEMPAPITPVLRYVSLPYIGPADNSMIAFGHGAGAEARFPNGVPGTSVGDSGGPAVWEMAPYVVIGINSGSGAGGVASVDLRDYRDWIVSTLNGG